jgi:hypothetical protein
MGKGVEVGSRLWSLWWKRIRSRPKGGGEKKMRRRRRETGDDDERS